MKLIDGECEYDCQLDNIISEVKSVTNNCALIKYVQNGIRKINGNLVGSYIDYNKSNFAFKNEEDSYIYINIEDDKVYVFYNNLNFREEVIYEKLLDGFKIQFFGNYRTYGERGIIELEKIEEESLYDSNHKFVMSDTHIEKNTCLNGLIMKRLMGTNYDRYVKQCVIGNEIVKIDEFNYHYIPEVNSRKCYISDYQNGIFCSVNENEYRLPLYSEVTDDFSNYEFGIRKVEKKYKQKQKTLIK